LPPNLGEKYFSGKHRVIFGQLIFFGRRENRHPYFLSVFCFSFHVFVKYSFEF